MPIIYILIPRKSVKDQTCYIPILPNYPTPTLRPSSSLSLLLISTRVKKFDHSSSSSSCFSSSSTLATCKQRQEDPFFFDVRDWDDDGNSRE